MNITQEELDKSLLFSLGFGKNIDMVKTLIKHGANPNATTSVAPGIKNTIISRVLYMMVVDSYFYRSDKESFAFNYEAMKLLIEHGGDINLKFWMRGDYTMRNVIEDVIDKADEGKTEPWAIEYFKEILDLADRQ
jgi:ankyrin repeat protein